MKLLIVDDEEGMREGMRRLLERRGHSVDTAADGAAAAELLGRVTYDIALVDLKLPGLDGFEVTQRINDREGNRTVVVIVSALATVEAAMEVTRRGAFDFLIKPFAPDELMAVLDRAIRQRQLIQERETYLSELNQERSLSHQLINTLRDGVVVLNVNHKPVLMNPRAESMLGVGFRDDLSLSDLGLGDSVTAMVQEALNAAGEGAYRQTRVERPDAVLEVRVIPWVRPAESPSVIVLLGDVTEQVRVEHDKNRFISMVAHELTSPLAAISSYLAIVLEGTLDGKTEKLKEVIGRSKTRTDALLELVRDLQDLNRREAGRVERAPQRLDLRAVLREQVNFYHGPAERHGVTLELEDGTEAAVMADRGDLDRIFMNLISNGIKYNREGGRVSLRIERRPGEILVHVEDTGIGMSPDEVAGIFQEFYRAHNPQTQGISGTGLGLATVKRVLAACNGRIDVRSVPGKGSLFSVSLPAAP